MAANVAIFPPISPYYGQAEAPLHSSLSGINALRDGTKSDYWALELEQIELVQLLKASNYVWI
jgi:hypothetical protein